MWTIFPWGSLNSRCSFSHSSDNSGLGGRVCVLLLPRSVSRSLLFHKLTPPLSFLCLVTSPLAPSLFAICVFLSPSSSPLKSQAPFHSHSWWLEHSHRYLLDCVSSVQSLSHVQLFATPWIAVRRASLSITNSWSSLRLTSIESVMPSSHLILCCPLLLLPPIPPSIRVFSNESTLRMRWPKYWSFSFSIIPSKEIPGLISFRMDWLASIFTKAEEDSCKTRTGF